MARQFDRPQLSSEQKRKICLYLSAGCDREAAAKLTDCSAWDIFGTMLDDAKFAAEVRSAEGVSELAHMRNIQNAALDVKNWRASIWWLERRSPERFGRRAAGAVTARHLKAFVAHLVTIITEELPETQARERLFIRLDELVKSLDKLLFDDGSAPSNVTDAGATNLLEPSTDDATDMDDDFA